MQSGNNDEGCRSQKILFQPNMHVFLQYSVNVKDVFEVLSFLKQEFQLE